MQMQCYFAYMIFMMFCRVHGEDYINLIQIKTLTENYDQILHKKTLIKIYDHMLHQSTFVVHLHQSI